MSYHYSYGPSLSDQGISPDDYEYLWRCANCSVEEYTPDALPAGWEVIETGERGDDVAFVCGRCVARL